LAVALIGVGLFAGRTQASRLFELYRAGTRQKVANVIRNTDALRLLEEASC